MKSPKKLAAWTLLAVLLVNTFSSSSLSKYQAQAASAGWAFSSPSGYAYDPGKIEFGSAGAQLKASSSNWFDSMWRYRREVTFDNANSTTTLNDIQVDLELTSANFDFAKAMANGEDVRVTDSDGKTSLPIYLDGYDATAQYAKVWVKAPVIEAGQSHKFYIYYGNSSVATASSFESVFSKLSADASTTALWHFDEGQGVAAKDDSGHGSDLNLNYVKWTESDGGGWGKNDNHFSSGSSLKFATDEESGNPASAYNPNIVMPAEGTVEFWIKPDYNSVEAGHRMFFLAGNADNYYMLYFNRGSGDLRIDSLTGLMVESKNYEFESGKWCHVAYTYDSLNNRHIYINGRDETKLNDPLVTATDITGFAAAFSELRWDVEPYTGNMDEIRIYDKALSWQEVKASFNRRNAYPSSMPLVKNVDNPALPNTLAWEGVNVDEATMLYEEGMFKTWYRGGHPFENPFSSIGYATSSDGVAWSKMADPVLSELNTGLWTPFVMKHDGVYYMYYSHEPPGSVWLATSTDGVNWQPYGEVMGKSFEIVFGNKFVFVDDDGVWKMLYEWKSGVWKINLATSSDGINWNKYDGQTVLTAPLGSVGGPEIHKIDGRYYMWAQTAPVDVTPTDIYLYESDDLIHWSNGELFMARDVGTWENNQVADPSLVELNGATYFYYDGVDGPTELTGVAVSSSTIKQLAYHEQIPESSVGGEEAAVYPSDNPRIETLTAVDGSYFDNFVETAVKNGGNIAYQLSPDNGSTWYWYDSGWTVATGGYEEASPASDIAEQVKKIPSAGRLKVRAYLNSNGDEPVGLANISVNTHQNNGASWMIISQQPKPPAISNAEQGGIKSSSSVPENFAQATTSKTEIIKEGKTIKEIAKKAESALRKQMLEGITQPLSFGETKGAVKILQKFLNLDPETRVAASGPGAPNLETNNFGQLTLKAVIRFQEKYAADILKPLGLSRGTGFVGDMTIKKIRQLANTIF